MITYPAMRREMRYGMPAADQIVFNRQYVLGYSYYFRQAKWALEIVDRENTALEDQDERERVERENNFRPDYRIPPMFRADLADYQGSGYDRGHLVCSANKNLNVLENSETFLLSNMSPQSPRLNRSIWRVLEERIRDYDARDDVYETFVICGPVFLFDHAVTEIGATDANGVTLPVPHAFFKSILAEDHRGRIRMWSFVIPNEETSEPLESFIVPTTTVERYAGLLLWANLVGTEVEREKAKPRKAWW